jgi:uncharacterized Fe-S cluster-containing radical SAM superfamily protein
VWFNTDSNFCCERLLTWLDSSNLDQCVNPDHVVTPGVVKDASGETFTKITLINGESISVEVALKETMRMLDNRKEGD